VIAISSDAMFLLKEVCYVKSYQCNAANAELSINGHISLLVCFCLFCLVVVVVVVVVVGGDVVFVVVLF
jgi:hypothetical protein